MPLNLQNFWITQECNTRMVVCEAVVNIQGLIKAEWAQISLLSLTLLVFSHKGKGQSCC